jgi:sortase (surface protein transpeptidase)
MSVPSLGISSPLLHLGLQADGALQVPEGEDFDKAAWYDGSPRPGDAGPAVIEGHVSSRDRGPSVFFSLSRVAVGARVDVLREDGTTASFQVYDVQQFPKDGFPTRQVYGGTPGAELRLITCGGTIAESDGRFTDNVVVFAHAVGG